MILTRTRAFLLNLVGLIVGKGGVVIAGLALVPLLISAGGVQTYGMWAACGQLLAYTAALDLGLGVGLQNLVSHAVSEEQRRRVAAAAGWGLIVLAVISVCLIAMMITTQWLAPTIIDGLFGPGGNEGLNGRAMVALVVVAVAITLLAQIPVRLVAGFQLQGRASLIQGGVALLVVGGIPLAAAWGFPLMVGLALAIVPPILAPAVWAWWRLSQTDLQWARPTLVGDRTSLFPVLRAGLMLFVSQIAALIVFQTDVILVSITNGPIEAARFATCARLLSIPILAQGIILAALWPALAQAHAQGDHRWIARSYRKMLRVTLGVIMPLSLVLALASQWIILRWSGAAEAVPERGLVCAYFIFSLTALWANIHAQCLNASGKLMLPAMVGLIQAAINLVAVIVAVRFWGAEGVAWASAACAVVTSVIILPIAWNRHLSRQEQ